MEEENKEEYIPPNYNINVNLSPEDIGELNWESNLMYLINKSEGGNVMIPARHY